MSLDSTTWSRVAALFDEIAQLPADQRRDRLSRIETAEVREWVERLLEAHDTPGEAFVDQALDEIVEHMLDEQSDVFQVMPENLAGKEFGNWRAVREIGRGGMGVVMRGERADGQFEKQVAIKLLPPGPVGPERRDRFLAEIRALARLEHPNIAHLIDGGISDDGIPYLVMEFVEGMRIDHWCRQQQASLQQRLRLLLKVASAVSYAHGKLVVHADIQPANVLVNTQGEPKLVDFGIAGLLRPQLGGHSDAADVLLQCSPAYAAPEQLRGERLTTACDVFGLGALMYELLTGQRIRDGRDVTAVLLRERRIEDRISPPSQVQSGMVPVSALRGDLDAICCKALAARVEQRYANVQEFSDDIAKHLAHYPVRARAAGRLYAFCRWLRRNRIMVTTGGLAAAALLTGASVALWQAGVARTEANRAHAQAQRAVLVRDFLQTVFVSTDPSDGSVPDALDLLNEGARRAREDIAGNDPAAAADILLLTGISRLALNQMDVAASDLRDAMNLLQNVGGQTSRELSEIHWNLGRFYKRRGPIDSAIEHYSEAVKLMEQWSAPAEERLKAKSSLGSALMEAGKLEKAETLVREVLQEIPAAGLEISRLHLDTLNHLSTIINLAGRNPEEQLPIHEKRFQIARNLYGEDNGWYAYTLADAVPTYRMLGLHREAIDLASRAEKRARQIYGEPHLIKAVAICNYAAVLLQAGRLDDALERYNESIRIDSALDRNDLHAESCRRGRAYVRAAQGDFRGSRADLARSREMLVSRDHRDSSQWLANCGLEVSVLLRMGKVRQAAHTLEECKKSEAARVKELPLEYEQALAELHFFNSDFQRSAELLNAMRSKHTPERTSRRWMRPWTLSLLLARKSGQPKPADLVSTLAAYDSESTIARCIEKPDPAGQDCLALP